MSDTRFPLDVPPKLIDRQTSSYDKIKVAAILQKVADHLNCKPELRQEFLDALRMLANP